MRTEKHLLAGVLLVSMGALALEVVMTRIFSVTMWYHFAFLAISMALMGSAVAGVVLYFFPKLTEPDAARRWIGRAAAALAVAVPAIFLLYLRVPFRPVLMNREGGFSPEQLLYLAFIYILLSIPFFLSGTVLALTLAAWPRDAGRIYWADLTGAAVGCLFSIAALSRFGGVNAVFALSIVLALGALAFLYGRRGWWLIGGLIILLTGGLLYTNLNDPWVRIVANKAGGEEPEIVYEKWNVHSRVTVYEPDVFPFFWGVSGEKWEQTIAEGDADWQHALLLIDAVAGTPIQNFTGDLERVDFLRYDLTSLVYHLIDQPRTLVIGPGGGRDVLSALVSGAPDVTAVEVNPAVIEAVRGPFAEFAGNLYERPDVHAVVADARGYIDRSEGGYDVIQASLIDTWAAGGSGAFALSENSLYTKEAFQSYYEHLSDRGILTVSRWYLPDRPAETMRLVATGMAGWGAAGAADPRDHVVVVTKDASRAQTEGLSTTLFKKQPWTPAELEALRRVTDELFYDIVYVPGMEPFEEVGRFITAPDHDAFIAEYPLDISPATDNRPFFFNLVLLGDLFDPALSGSGVYRTSMEAIYVLFAVIGVSVTLSLLFILVPLWLGGKRRGLARPSAPVLGYFAMLGLAFMLVEIPTMQKLTVYLGQPIYSLAVVLFSLLLFSGLGSLWSGRWAAGRVLPNMRIVFPALIIFLLLHAAFSAVVLEATLRYDLPVRLLVAVALLSVMGFLMGIPFPVGIRVAGGRQPAAVPWFWGINGVMSVLGSALATALSIHIGFRSTLFVAMLAYAAAGGLMLLAFSPSTDTTAEPPLPESDRSAPGISPA
jgi:hypothetical protein